jgi:hypothetical protein
MIGKKFTEIQSGRILEVKDRFEDIVVFTDKSKIKLSRLLDRNYYDEYIDPQNFFRNESLMNVFADKIRQIPDDVVKKIKDDGETTVPMNENLTQRNEKPKKKRGEFEPAIDEPAILQADPELERLELMRKYGINSDPIQEAQRQLEKFKQILDEDEKEWDEEVDSEQETEVQVIEVDREEEYDEPVQEIRSVVKASKPKVEPKVVQDDPIIAMFKNVKRNREFKVNFEFENMIPRPDFIEMMEDSYNTSIIEFLADEFCNQILQNPDILKNKIIDEIKKIVYPQTEVVEEVKQKVEPKKTPVSRGRRPKNKKTEIAND